ncbi:signal peptide peptidase SppA [Lentibacillus sediminis]|uniref:signal peptide peptidase SppA n=1 Tax=Lentibacillus sediminis TaxID=1940529 RepID=UPI000C1BA0D3|nr:signal peptide peptidase SppA [Lentibacillus sediminis]
MNKRRWIALLIAAVLLVVSLGWQAVTSIATADFEEIFSLQQQQEYQTEVVEEGSPANKIAVMRLNGVIQNTTGSPLNTATYNHTRFLDMMETAAEDPTVGGIILRVNTPGGGVVESAQLHDQVVEIQETYEKPVYVSMGNTAASGGYYLAASADKIVAHPGTLTGSIGVIMQSFNVSELADNIGIDMNTIKSGEFKDIMSPTREMTEEEREILQTMIDDMYADFVQVIVEGRDMTEERVRELGDGRVYTGSQALEQDLVDALGNLEDTIAMMKEEQGLENAQVVEYSQGLGLNQFLGGAVQAFTGANPDIDNVIEMVRESHTPRAMYLYSE